MLDRNWKDDKQALETLCWLRGGVAIAAAVAVPESDYSLIREMAGRYGQKRILAVIAQALIKESQNQFANCNPEDIGL